MEYMCVYFKSKLSMCVMGFWKLLSFESDFG